MVIERTYEKQLGSEGGVHWLAVRAISATSRPFDSFDLWMRSWDSRPRPFLHILPCGDENQPMGLPCDGSVLSK